MKEPIIEVEWLTTETDRICGCCREQAVGVIKIGTDFGSFSQTSSFPLCSVHMEKLKQLLN